MSSFFKICHLLGASSRASIVTSLILGLATLCWAYSVRNYSEPVQLCLTLGTVYYVLKGSTRNDYAAGACFSGLVLVKAASLVYLPIFLAYVFMRPGFKLRATCRFAVPVLVTIAILAVLNWVRFGDILEFGYGAEARMFSLAGLPENIVRLLFSTSFGLFVYSPALLLGLALFPRFARTHTREAVLFILLIATNLILNASWYAPHGGHSWGPRLLVPTLGIWLVPLATTLDDLRGGIRTLGGIVVIVSFIIVLGGVLETVRPATPPRRSVSEGSYAVVLVNKAMNKLETMRVDRYPLNLWYVHVGNRLKRPQLAWIFAVTLGALGLVIGSRLRREIRKAQA